MRLFFALCAGGTAKADFSPAAIVEIEEKEEERERGGTGRGFCV
jgi:hypothetical protein